MSTQAKSKTEVVNQYISAIKAKFPVTDDQAKVLAERSFNQIEAHGGNALDLSLLEDFIEIVVRVWVHDKRF